MAIRALSAVQVATAGFLALAVAMGVGRFAFTPLLPMMLQEGGLTVVSGGWLASANYLGYLVGALAVAAVRVPAGPAIRNGMVVIGLATLAMGFEHSFPVWVVLRVIAGLANAWVAIHAFAWSIERAGLLRRPQLTGIAFAGVGVGIVVVGALCVLLMRLTATSAESWIILGIVSLILTAGIWNTFDASAAVPAAPRPEKSVTTWNGDAIRMVLYAGTSGFGYIIPATFLPVMARQVIQDPAIYGWSWPVFGVATAVSPLLVARMSGRIDRRSMLIGWQLVMALGVALPVVCPGFAAIMFAALAVGGTFVTTTMVTMQEARVMGGNNATGLMAALTAAFASGQIVGPLSVSFLIGADGDFSTALMLATVVLVAGALALARRSPAGGTALPENLQLSGRKTR